MAQRLWFIDKYTDFTDPATLFLTWLIYGAKRKPAFGDNIVSIQQNIRKIMGAVGKMAENVPFFSRLVAMLSKVAVDQRVAKKTYLINCTLLVTHEAAYPQ